MISSSLGKRRRLGRLFRRPSGNSIVIALDHGLFMGSMTGIEQLPASVEALIGAAPDAIQVGPGAAEWITPLLDAHPQVSLVLRMDATNAWRRPVGQPATQTWVASAEDAVHYGADAAVVYLFGQPEAPQAEAENFRQVADMIRDCGRLGLPIMVEPLMLGGATRESDTDPVAVAMLTRIAYEMGADVLKIDPPLRSGAMDYDALRQICDSVPVPVLVRGGPKVKDESALLASMRQAVAAGSRGVVFGRNVWQAPNPAEAVLLLRDAVHGSRED